RGPGWNNDSGGDRWRRDRVGAGPGRDGGRRNPDARDPRAAARGSDADPAASREAPLRHALPRVPRGRPRRPHLRDRAAGADGAVATGGIASAVRRPAEPCAIASARALAIRARVADRRAESASHADGGSAADACRPALGPPDPVARADALAAADRAGDALPAS